MTAEPTDEALMLAYAKGDMAAFTQLYHRHKDPLLRFFLRQVPTRSIAEELFQDVWAKVVGSRATYSVDAKFTTWLYTLARHRLIDDYRKRGKVIEVDFDHADVLQEDSSEAHYTQAQRRQQLRQLVATLPEAQRQPFVLKYDAGFSEQDIALITATKPETVKSQIRYAIKKLKAGFFGGSHDG